MNHSRYHRIILALGGTAVIALIFLLPFYFSAQQVAAIPMAQTLPTLSFNTSNTNVSENVGTTAVTVNISAAPLVTRPVTVTYTTINGSATAGAGADYIATSGTITFTASGSKSFNVTINDDSASESNETINLVLQAPQNATLGTPNSATITIQDNDPTPTATGAIIIFADAQEPNDSFGAATDIASDAPTLCGLTLWPIGDVDYFRFNGKSGSTYTIKTSGLSSGLDTFMRVFDPSLNLIATNDDDGSIGSRASSITIVVSTAGFYYVEITNVDPTDPTGKEYCIEVDEVQPLTATPSNTPVPGEDNCEFNSTIPTACLIGVGEEVELSFVPSLGSEQDTDFLKMWVLPGVLYTCETFDLAAVTDTNIILLDQNGNAFNPWIGNADRAIGDPSSEVSYLATYKGYIYVLIGPEHIPPYEESFLHTYSARCTATIATSTPTPRPTTPPSTGGGGTGGGIPTATATPFDFPTPVPTPTPIDFSFLTPEVPTPPVVQFEPLPTSTAVSGAAPPLTINLTLYYDSNKNFMPELTEGIMDTAIALYENATGELIAFGYTNEAGMMQFSDVETSGAVRVEVPFLNYSQIVVGTSSDILIRIAPQPLPIGIP